MPVFEPDKNGLKQTEKLVHPEKVDEIIQTFDPSLDDMAVEETQADDEVDAYLLDGKVYEVHDIDSNMFEGAWGLRRNPSSIRFN